MKKHNLPHFFAFIMSTVCKQEHDCFSFPFVEFNRLDKLQSVKLKYASAETLA